MQKQYVGGKEKERLKWSCEDGCLCQTVELALVCKTVPTHHWQRSQQEELIQLAAVVGQRSEWTQNGCSSQKGGINSTNRQSDGIQPWAAWKGHGVHRCYNNHVYCNSRVATQHQQTLTWTAQCGVKAEQGVEWCCFVKNFHWITVEKRFFGPSQGRWCWMHHDSLTEWKMGNQKFLTAYLSGASGMDCPMCGYMQLAALQKYIPVGLWL